MLSQKTIKMEESICSPMEESVFVYVRERWDEEKKN